MPLLRRRHLDVADGGFEQRYGLAPLRTDLPVADRSGGGPELQEEFEPED